MNQNTIATRHAGMETVSLQFQELTKRWPSISARQWVEQFIEMANDQGNIRAIVAFGSIVRDVDNSLDVDLLLVYEDEKPISTTPPLDVDLRAYRKSDIDSLLAEGHELLCWSVRFGKLLHEKRQFWSSLHARWLRHLPFPSARTADKRAQRAARLLEDLKAIGDVDAAQEQLVAMLTHLARAHLIRAEVFPASRPELPEQLRSIGESTISSQLTDALRKRRELIGT